MEVERGVTIGDRTEDGHYVKTDENLKYLSYGKAYVRERESDKVGCNTDTPTSRAPPCH